MSVLIKGMEMPTSCGSCPFEESINFCYGKKETCPLVPVPPHGRLIDADALMKGEGRYIISFGKEGIDVAEINRAPTIIPAEEGE